MRSVDELLFLETDGGCACCGHRDMRALTIHHIEESKPKNENYDNKIVLCHNCHNSYHNGKGFSEGEIKEVKRRLIIKTFTRLGLNAMKHAFRKGRVIATPFLVNHLVEQQLLVYKEVITNYRPDDSWQEHVEIAALYEITEPGRQLMEKWGLNGA
jgi:hypothetical protein